MALYDVTALGTKFEYDTTAQFCTSVGRLPALDRVIVSWYQSTSQVRVQCFDVNPTTGAVTAVGSPVDIGNTADATQGISVVVIDASNAIVFFPDADEDGRAQLISIDGSGNCSTNGSSVEFDAALGTYPSAILWDATHALVVWNGSDSGAGAYAIIVSFNTGTGTISNVGSKLYWDNDAAVGYLSVAKLTSTKALAINSAGGNARARILDVNSGTFAVTTAGAITQFEVGHVQGTSCCLISDSGAQIETAAVVEDTAESFLHSLLVNTSTWAITTQSRISLGGATTGSMYSSSVVAVSDEVLLVFFRGSANDGFASTYPYDPSTGIGTVIDTIEFETSDFAFTAQIPADMSDGWYVTPWQGPSQDGFIQTFQVELTSGFVATPMLHHVAISGGLM